MSSGIDKRRMLAEVGITTAAEFAGDKPYIEYVDYGTQGGDFILHGDPDFRKIVEVTRDKKDQDAGFRLLAVWVRFKYGVTELDKTPFGTWMDRNFIRDRMKEVG